MHHHRTGIIKIYALVRALLLFQYLSMVFQKSWFCSICVFVKTHF